MSSNDSAAAQQASELTEKSKGKQVEQHDGGDMSMDDDSEGEDSGVEEIPEEADEDNMEEIDLDNIIGGRTRGKVIDWNEAEQKAKEAGDELGEEDDDDDEDFEDPDDEMKD
ncbi:Histone H2A.Z-specific chaperone CHZ1 [Neophaeococcomyces mojaviensis]|uniref:Histone H2A.Z-specific chaperone CHZ1 n=1 Tax=Neophaeococcomyces mojaviensis TaxID=3383035 RepID=A0ACC2ZZK9_9EURO|nr:Histone H2A.Z-specific chaperone CHZ1 [Knufia sp. JES_112]